MMLAGRRLAPPLALGLLLWGPPIALIALWPNKLAALLLVAVVGVGNSIEDVSALTLLQRDLFARINPAIVEAYLDRLNAAGIASVQKTAAGEGFRR